jgi:hypothetical protein
MSARFDRFGVAMGTHPLAAFKGGHRPRVLVNRTF